MAETATAAIELTAIDRASATLAAVKGKADQLTQSADSIRAAWGSGLFDSFTKGPALAAVGVIGAIGAAAVGLGAYFVGLAKDTMTAQAGLKSLSEVSGASVEWLSAVRTTAKLSGTEMEALGGGLTKMAKNIETGSSETAKGLAAIGLSIKDLQGLKSEEQFDRIARSLDGYADGAGKTAAAQLILGKSGAALLPFIKDYNELTEFSVKVTKQQAEQADSLEKDIKRLTAAKEAWKKVVGAELVPVLDDVVKVLLKVQTETGGTLSATKALAADGSIKAWAQDAARAVAMLVDIVATGTQIAKIIGLAFIAVGADATAMALKIASAAAPFDQALRIMADRAGAFAADMRAKFNAAFAAGVDPGKYQKQLDEQFANSAAQAARDARHFAEYGDTVGKTRKQITGLGEDAKAAAAEVVSAYGTMIAKIGERITAETALADTGEKLTAGQTFALSILKDLTTAKVKFTDAQKISITRALEEMLAIEKGNLARKKEIDLLIAAEKAKNEADEAWFQGEEKKRGALEAGIKSVRELIDATIQETKMLGLSNEERIIATALFKAQAAGIDTTTEAWAELAAQMRKAVYDKSAQEETLKNLEDTRKASESIWKGIGDDITNWIMGGFKNTRDLLKKMFEKLVLRPIIQPITNGVTGGLQSLVGSTGGGIGSLLTGGGSGLLGSLGGLLGSAAPLGFAGGSSLATAYGVFDSVMAGTGSMLEGLSAGFNSLAGELAPFLGPVGIIAGIGLALYSLFGQDEKGIRFDNSTRNVPDSKYVHNGALGRFAPSGDVTDEMRAAFDPLFDKVKLFDDYLAKNLLSDETLGIVREQIQNLTNPRWWNLEDADAVNNAAKYFLQQRYSTAFDSINKDVADTIRTFSGSADELLGFIQSFIVMRETVLAAQAAAKDAMENTAADVANLMEQQSNNVAASYRAQLKATDALLAMSPDAADALGAVVTGMQSLRSASAQLQLQIAQVRDALGTMFGDTIRSMRLSVLSVEDQYKFLQAEADQLMAKAMASNDALEIQRLAQQINADINQAFGLLTADQKAALAPDQIARIDAINKLLDERLNGLGTSAQTDANARMDALSKKLDEIATAMLASATKNNDAADKQLEAAKTPKEVDVNITVTDDRLRVQASEVGG